jgi:hypothetical protein
MADLGSQARDCAARIRSISSIAPRSGKTAEAA